MMSFIAAHIRKQTDERDSLAAFGRSTQQGTR
jgi:hypothetical protein